jgi:PspA associated protein B
VGFLDVLFGRKRLKDAAREQLFALSTAQVTLEVENGLKPAGKAAVVFKPLSAGEFVRAENELQELLDVVAQSTGARVKRSSDTYGYEWLVFEDSDFEDLVNAVHAVGDELQSRGFGPQLLAAMFRFDGHEHPVYWIYGYKRGTFWPFVPTGKDQERDNAEELELKAKLEPELPIEQDISRWFALFGAPL